MNDRSVKHSTFTLERTYAVTPDVVFAAWADRDTKAKWFAEQDEEYALDFRVGGEETVHGGDHSELVARSSYHDIVPGERLVYTTALFDDQTLVTVSLTTVQLEPVGEGTRLTLTEQGAFLGPEQPQWREQGTSDWLDALGRELSSS